MKIFYCFLIVVIIILVFPVLNAQDITGDWYGVCQIEDSLHINLHIYKDHDRLKATFDSPDQNEFGIPITKIDLVEDTLIYWIYGYGIHYKGCVNQDYSRIDGEVTQWGDKYGLIFGRKKLIGTSDTSLTVIPAKIFGVFPANSQKIPYNGTRVINAGIPRIIEIDTSQLNVLIPGKGLVLNPNVYELPESGTKDEYTDKEYYALYAPVIVKAKQTRPVPVQPMRMNDEASFNIQYLDMDQGLMDGDIWSVLEDSRGNMWFGSYLAGICRYDGRSLTYYTVKEGLTDNATRAMIEDRNGNIWIGTDRGLCKYDGKSFTQYPGELFKGVQSILESRNGNIWVGTRNGAFEKKGDTWTHYTEDEGLTYNQVLSILEDRSGNIWFATTDGISKFDGVSFTDFAMPFIYHCTESVIEDTSGNLWFGTDEGVFKYDGKLFYQYTVNEGLSSNLINSGYIDNNGYLWFGNWEDGVNIYNGKTFTHFTCKEGLSNNIINSIIEDKNRNIWLTTYGSGVMKLQRNSFTYLTQFDEIGKGRINSIIEDRNGNIWFGIFGVGLIKFDGESFIKITDEKRAFYSVIQSIIEGKDGNIWFANSADLQKYDGKSTTIYYDRQVSRIPPIECMYKDKKGNLWLGTFGEGIKKFDGESYTWFLGINSSPSQEYITSILQDKNENIWYGTISYGLFKYDGDSTTQYTINDGLSSNWISSLFEDETGNLWIGTSGGGINKFDGQSFVYFTEKEGLSTDFVSSVIGDKKGNIWVGTRKGLSLISSQGDGNYSITAFGTEDGLKDLNFNKNSVCLDSRNRLWWGTGNIVTILDLNMSPVIPKPPVIQLNNIYLNQKFVDFRSLLAGTEETEQSPSDTSIRMNMRGLKFSDVASFYNYPVDLKLPHYLNHVTFNFSAIDWTAPQSIRYQYMMEGMDEQWSLLSTENQADYRNIPSGKYKFKVKALSKANIWSKTFEYPFTVHPPWWLQWWAYTFYAMVIILLARYYISYRVNRERIKAEVQIKQVEVDKMQELDEMKSRFFANISHEFRTPLTLLTGPINDLLKNRDRLKENDRKLLGIMKRNAARLQQLINQLLDLSKLETGNLKLRVSEGNLEEFLRAIILSFLSLAESKQIRYEYNIPETDQKLYFDSDKVEKILTNLISNAFKFTPANGEINVSLQYVISTEAEAPQSADIKVSDTGKGIPPGKLDKIFDRFYQVSDSDTREEEGTGIGLALTRELVELYRGEISVESEVGKGSTFTVKLPVSKKLFKEEEIIKTGPDDTIREKVIKPGIEKEEMEVTETGDGHIKEIVKGAPVILIVEDNIDLRNYISGNLGNSYHILFAENGKSGLNSAIGNIPDLIISDLMMPEMDGMEMCKQIKSDERTNHIPVIILTAKADRSSKIEGLETGADDYIIKPFNAEELKIRVRNLIEQRKRLREKFSKQFLGQEKGQEPESFRDHLIKKIINTIDQHYSDYDFSVDKLGKELHMSRAQFFRKVHALTGTTPNELLRLYRIRKAASLIESGQDNITAVMYEVGFQSTSHFAKSFRKYYGKNPSEYRNSFAGRN